MTNKTTSERADPKGEHTRLDVPSWRDRRLHNGRWQFPETADGEDEGPAFVVISVKLRRAEAEEFRRVCAEAGVRPNRAFRAMARQAAGYIEMTDATTTELQDVARQVGGIATNINQIAKATNRTGSPDWQDLMEERKRLGPVLLGIHRSIRNLLDDARRRFDGRERLQLVVDRMEDDLI